VTSSVVLVTTAPIWVALASWLFLRERLSRAIVIGLIVTVLGGVIVGLSDACDPQTGVCTGFSLGGTQLWGDSLALIGAWMVSGYLLIGRYLRQGMSLFAYVYLVYGTAAVVLIAIVVLSGQSFLVDVSGVVYSPQAFVWLALLAILPQLVGHSSYNYALGYLPTTYVAVVSLAEPVGTSILAFVLLKELPAALTIIGAAIILCGIALASLPARTALPPA
jgi:drug/metabolite transporter (DMT)-like permease